MKSLHHLAERMSPIERYCLDHGMGHLASDLDISETSTPEEITARAELASASGMSTLANFLYEEARTHNNPFTSYKEINNGHS